nr:hypothetical protein [Tanacetum cinerariifolium]
MEQYLALSRENQASGVVIPEIEGNVNFEIKSEFMQELREDTFFKNKNEDAHDHGPIFGMTPTQALTAIQTMTDHSQKWHDGISSRSISSSSNTDGLAAIIRPHLNKECPLNKEVKGVEEVKYGEFRHLALFNGSNKANFHVGPIFGMTPTQALTAIQTMTDHSQKWHDGISSRSISSSSNTDGLAAIIRPHLNKECPLNKEVKGVEEVKYGEFRHLALFNGSNKANFHVVPPGYYTRIDNQTPSGEKRPNLVEKINKYMEGVSKR